MKKRPPGCWKVRTIFSSSRTAIRTGTRWALLWLLCPAGCKMCQSARAWNARRVPAKFSYLWREVEQEAIAPRFFVAVDVADPKLLGKRLEERYAAHIDLCIDHHGSNTLYAAQTLLDASAGAACEVIYEVLRD